MSTQENIKIEEKLWEDLQEAYENDEIGLVEKFEELIEELYNR